MQKLKFYWMCLSFCLALVLLQGCAVQKNVASTSNALDVAIASPQRSAEFYARDIYRHPKQTLEFFGVAPDMTVVEIWPSSGWYTQILAPYLRDRGRYYAAGFAISSDGTPQWRIDMQKEFNAKLVAQPALYRGVIVTELGAPDSWVICPAGTADRVLSFRNVHNWVKGDYQHDMFKAFYKALKPGGVLGIVEHRAPPDFSMERMKQSGYITEAYVIQLAREAGFKLADKSKINANPNDSKDYVEGVWTLPPTLKLGDKNRDRYIAIGESDRMTLKFVKP